MNFSCYFARSRPGSPLLAPCPLTFADSCRRRTHASQNARPHRRYSARLFALSKQMNAHRANLCLQSHFIAGITFDLPKKALHALLCVTSQRFMCLLELLLGSRPSMNRHGDCFSDSPELKSSALQVIAGFSFGTQKN